MGKRAAGKSVIKLGSEILIKSTKVTTQILKLQLIKVNLKSHKLAKVKKRIFSVTYKI